jgi:hypothetical protein
MHFGWYFFFGGGGVILLQSGKGFGHSYGHNKGGSDDRTQKRK